MFRTKYLFLSLLALFYFILGATLPSALLAQEKTNPRGTLKVVDLWSVARSAMLNYAEGLVMLDKDNNFVPCLAEDWRWIDERTIEFRLRREVSFQNGEPFNAEAVRLNWEAYDRLKPPTFTGYSSIADGTVFEMVNDYAVRFTFPEPDGLALVRLRWFFQFAPAFFAKHKFDVRGWGYLSEAGPWGTGPFELVEGSVSAVKPSDRLVLEAYEAYWDTRYPKVKTVIFDNTLLKDREEAMRLCRETEGAVDIVSFIRPLDTLKVAESPSPRRSKAGISRKRIRPSISARKTANGGISG